MITSTGGFVPQSEKYSRFMAGESLKKYVELHRGEFAYNKGNSKTYPQGCVFRLDGWEKAAVPNVYFSFAVNEKQISPEYAAQFFVAGGLNSQLKNVITSGARGNGLLNVSPEDFFGCHLPLPPLAEQRKIAAILTSVDEAIQATEAVIAQTRRVKEGLLQELLTKGIGHTRFAEGPLGKVPRDWRLGCVEDVCTLVTKGTTPPSGTMHRSGEVPYLRVGNLTFDGTLNITDLLFIARDIHQGTLKRSIIRVGDVLTNIVGPPLGQVALVDDRYPEWNMNQAIAVFRPNRSRLLPPFLAYFLQSTHAKEWLFARAKQTSGQVNLTLQLCRELPLPLPTLSEQTGIVQRMDAINTVLESSNNQKQILQVTKSGLLQDLLSGRVRVKNFE